MTRDHLERANYHLLTLVFLLSIAGCQAAETPPDPYIGVMTDFTYSGRRGKPYGRNAEGRPVGLAQFEGKFVWVDYSAPWCGPCDGQARIMAGLERALSGSDVVILTVLTSGEKPHTPTSPQLAKSWARRYGLDPKRVVAGDEWYRTIPQHSLFSPRGQTLYNETGLHSDAQIRSVLAEHQRKYETWYAANKNSTSVLLNEVANSRNR